MVSRLLLAMGAMKVGMGAVMKITYTVDGWYGAGATRDRCTADKRRGVPGDYRLEVDLWRKSF